MYASRTTLLGVTVFAALGLVAAPAHAQSLTLNDGDNVTVSGTGTVGTVGGTPVANTTSTYTDADGKIYAVQTNGTSTFTLAEGGIVSSAKNYNYGLLAEGSGPVTVSGGSISAGQGGTGLFAVGSVTISGGSISGGQGGTALDAYEDGAVTISGGTLSAGVDGRGIFAEGSGSITISGGSISTGQGGTALADNRSGPVTINGGSISAGAGGTALADTGSGPVTISGGSISTGAGGFGLFDYQSTLNLFSFGDTPFLIDGVPMNNTTLDGSLYQSGTDTISGTLANGDVLDTTFQDFNGTINLNTPAAVPEASTTVSFGLLLALGLSGVVLARKKSVKV